MTASAAAMSRSLPGRLWAAYLRQLGARPLRTKMITSGTLFLLGDTVAQIGIEGRRIIGHPDESREEEGGGKWDHIRAARLCLYGTVVFAPLAHTWLGLVDKVRYPSKARTLVTRLALDQLLWGPAIVCIFWGANGILEGKTPEEVWQKVSMAFIPSYSKSVCVFGPTQVINFSLVPLQHRLAVQQTVGLGWNIYLSYVNNINNRRLAAASAALALAQAEELPDVTPALTPEREKAEHELDVARAQREKIRQSGGGGATGVGTRMGW